jgi:hypothetical protein
MLTAMMQAGTKERDRRTKHGGQDTYDREPGEKDSSRRTSPSSGRHSCCVFAVVRVPAQCLSPVRGCVVATEVLVE